MINSTLNIMKFSLTKLCFSQANLPEQKKNNFRVAFTSKITDNMLVCWTENATYTQTVMGKATKT